MRRPNCRHIGGHCMTNHNFLITLRPLCEQYRFVSIMIMDGKEILAELRKAKQERKELRLEVDNLAIATKNSFDRVDDRFDIVEDNQARLERGMKAILEVVQESNVLLKECLES